MSIYQLLLSAIAGFSLAVILVLLHDIVHQKPRPRSASRTSSVSPVNNPVHVIASQHTADLNAVALRAAITLLDEAIRAGVVNNTATSGVSTNRAGTSASPLSRRPE